MLELRARMMTCVRAYFADEGFVEVDPPTIVPSPGLDVHLSAFEVRGPTGELVGYLSTSPEYQMKRLLSDGMKRIFAITRAYRADEEGPLHQHEFAMLEWYRTDAGSVEVIADTEQLVARIAQELTGEQGVTTPGGKVDLSPPWSSMTVADAYRKFADVDVDTIVTDESRFYRLMVDRVQPALGKGKPTVLTDWPACMASLAKLKSPTIADRFEVFVDGIELCNGFGELTDPVEQRARFEADQRERQEHGLPVYPIDERFIEALEHGMPEAGGNALGLDRLLMLLTGATKIADVTTFGRRQL